MPSTELTNYSFHAEYNSSTSADELFVKHSIPELRALEKRTRSDIEKKKQELRLMVGERYRDLIDAADSIVNMRHCALSIQEELHHMQDSCDVNALKSTVKAQINEDKKGTKDEKKHHLYSSAAQIKLLVDVPEQIWRSLESHKYLNASRLYLIAKLVYKNLQAHNEDAPFNVSVTFPVVQRQWDAVSHFKAQILQKATLYLKVIEQSEQSLAETLCAIMLLDDVTKKDVFRKCLDMRTSALIQILKKSEAKDTKSMVDQFREMIRLIRGTVYHVGSVFISAVNEQSLFESYLHQLQQGFTVYEDSAQPSPVLMSPRDSKASLTRLYSPSTNIHLLVRYLPESIQTFTPFLHLSGTRGQLSQEDITTRMNLWVDQIVEQFHEKLNALLSKITCAKELNELRKIIWEFLKEDELVKEENQSSFKRFPSKVHRTSLGFELNIQKTALSWFLTCHLVFHKSFSIWNDLLRNGFNKRFKDIIISSFSELSNQPEKLLKNRLYKLEDSNNEERHLGNFIWADGSTFFNSKPHDNTASVFKNRIELLVSGQTSLVNDAKIAFDKNLKDIKDDMEPVFVLSGNDRTNELFLDDFASGELFNANSDTEDLSTFFQETIVSSVTSYRDQLYSLLEEVDTSDKNEDSQVITVNNAKRLLIGRIAYTIAYESTELPILLQLVFVKEKKVNQFNSRLSSSLIDSRLVNLRQTLMDVYFPAHQPWIKWITHNVQVTISEMLSNNTHWDETNVQTLVWEEVTIQDPIQGQEGNKMKLPSQPSTTIMNCLFNACQEINRVGSPTLHENVIKDLYTQIFLKILDLYTQFVSDTTQFTNVSEQSAIQLLYDIKFLKKIFECCWSPSMVDIEDDIQTYKQREQMINQILEAIRPKIDPIDFEIFKPFLDKNVERHYTRSSIMLGLLIQLNPKITDIRRKGVALQDYHNILAVAPQAARFTLLPISHKVGQKNRS
ncbi:Conserved oligomeric golgi complex subunit 1 [Gigaspora margarita]|uniref:Conserved oligomeric Golgi complex subunit 1 n=2 Tax=Gigasporaceae TaxID=36753 RepID=A0A8H4AFF9_GIGMA|nr:Conserved oligomeric golgi complex subunit 1 [Gigaspora margarita]